ncbi:MAG TPA: hypothetical protein VGN61_12120 [Verrucomicrobiae bacterium]|jgi:hypothetical protein
MDLTVDTFQTEIAEALKSYDMHIVCIDKTPEECKVALMTLMDKAIRAYVSRGPHLRHGIALDKQVTIILSQTEQDLPLCGIYFNLHSPYKKKSPVKAKKED